MIAVIPPTTTQEAQQGQIWFEFLKLFVPFVAGGVFVWLANRWAIKRDVFNRTQKAKDDFRIAMSLKKEAIPTKDFGEFYARTQPEIRTSISILLPLLNEAQIRDIEIIWLSYTRIGREELNDTEEEDNYRGLYAVDGTIAPRKPSEKLRLYYDKFSKAVE